MLIRNGYEIPALEVFDPEVLAKWVWADQEQGDLEHLTLRATNMGQWRPNLRKLELEDFETMSDANLSRRCGNDAEAALRLARLLEPEIDKQGLRRIWNLAMDVLPILARVEIKSSDLEAQLDIIINGNRHRFGKALISIF